MIVLRVLMKTWLQATPCYVVIFSTGEYYGGYVLFYYETKQLLMYFLAVYLMRDIMVA